MVSRDARNDFAKKMKEYRERQMVPANGGMKPLSQDGLAERIDESQTAISAWERGVMRPDDPAIEKFRVKCELSPAEFEELLLLRIDAAVEAEAEKKAEKEAARNRENAPAAP